MLTLSEAVTAHQAWKSGQDTKSRFSWGQPWLDDALGPAVPGSLVVAAARTGVGKSFFGLSLLASSPVPALYVSLEDTVAEVGRRGQPITEARRSKIWIAAPSHPRLSSITRSIDEAVEAGARLVVVDYLNLIRYDGDIAAFSKTEQVGHVISDLKGQARAQEFLLVLNVQVRRPIHGSEDEPPRLYELRDSSDIENSAEVVVLLHDEGNDLVSARIAKNKTGRAGAKALYQRGPEGFLVEASSDEDDFFDE